MLGEGVRIEEGVRLGAHVVIHDGVYVGEGCVIEDHVVLGKSPKLASTSSAAFAGSPRALEIGPCTTICSGAVVFAGAQIGEAVILGDQSYVRERSFVGMQTVIGRGSVVDNDVQIGRRVRVQTNVYLTAFSLVEDDVFLGPGAITSNDHTMSRHDPDEDLSGAFLRRACRIGAGAVLTPGVEVGEEAILAAGAVLTKDLPPRAVAMGVPARVVREVPDEDLLERWR